MSTPDPFSSRPNIKEEKAVWLARLTDTERWILQQNTELFMSDREIFDKMTSIPLRLCS